MFHPVSLKQRYDAACSHTPQQIVICNKYTMYALPTNVPNSKINFFKSPNTNSPLLSSCQKTVKTMPCNKTIYSTSSKNSVSDTSKFQSFLYIM